MSGHFELKRTANQRHMYNLKASNGEIILTSNSFHSHAAAAAGIAAVKKRSADEASFERKLTSAQQPYFVLKGAGGEVLGHSEPYSAAAAMEHGILSVMHNGPEATVKEIAQQI